MKHKLSFLAVILTTVLSVSAQTNIFTYQGRLSDSGGLAASYDFTMLLCATAAANCAVGDGALAFQLFTAIPVSSEGVFTLPVSFAATNYDGSARYLKILMRRNAQGSYVELTPRQEILSTPHAIQSLKATSAGNVTGIVAVANGGTGSATQNFVDLTTVQTAIAGNKTFTGTVSANAVNATTQYNVFGNRILGNTGTNNIFVGIGAGTANTTGNGNSFVGRSSGGSNTTAANTFIGSEAGLLSTTTSGNSFIGSSAGRVSTGADNSFIGANAGLSNTNGANNSFVGSLAGANNTSGSRNLFIGASAGLNNSSGNDNIYIGRLATNASSGTQLNNSMAIGNDVTVAASNTITLGASTHNTQIRGNLQVFGGRAGSSTQGASFESAFTNSYGYGLAVNKLYMGSGFSDPVFTPSPMCVQNVGLEIPYGHVGYCANGTMAGRFKNDVATFAGGIETIRRLRPVSFTWKENNDAAVGLNAEEVAEIDERFINRDEKGEIRDVKETALTVLLINAVKQQQEQIDRMQKKIEQLQKLACDAQPASLACKP